MGLIYDAFFFDRDGNRLPSCDLNTASPMIRKGCYTQHVCTNWDGRSEWYGPDGKEIDSDSLPWLRSQPVRHESEADRHEREQREWIDRHNAEWKAGRA